MSTSWLPLVSIPFETFKANPPPGFHLAPEQSEYIDPERHLCYGDGTSYIHIYKTKNGGTEFEQFNVNQEHQDILVKIGKAFNTKLMSYIGEPWDDPDLKDVNYHDLWSREWK